MRGTVVLFCFCLLVACCTSNEVPVSDQSFFPLRVGNFQIYQVTETAITRLTCDGNGQVQQNYQLKTLVTDSSKNNEGGYTYTVHRYTRQDETQPWGDLDTWTARASGSQVVVNESNVPYLKFTYPLVEKAIWNINTYNNMGKTFDTLKNFHQPFTLGNGNKIENTFSAQRDSVDAILYFFRRKEVYAPSIGLVFSEDTQLQYFDLVDDPCYGHQVVKTGSTYLQSLISYGHQ